MGTGGSSTPDECEAALRRRAGQDRRPARRAVRVRRGRGQPNRAGRERGPGRRATTAGCAACRHGQELSLAADVARRRGLAATTRWWCRRVPRPATSSGRSTRWSASAVRAGRRHGRVDGPRRLRDDAAYVRHGALWWAFDRESASRRGLTDDEPEGARLRVSATRGTGEEPAGGGAGRRDRQGGSRRTQRSPRPAGSFRFEVDRLKSEDKPVQVVAARAPLRHHHHERGARPASGLPPAVHHAAARATQGSTRLEQIARAHFPGRLTDDELDLVVEKYPAIQALRARQGRPRGQHRRVPRRRRRLHRPQDRARTDRSSGAGSRSWRSTSPATPASG